MKKVFISWLSILCTLTAQAASGDQSLSCKGTRQKEAVLIAHAPAGSVKRINAHRLDIKWAGGVKTFRDRLTAEIGEEDAETYVYCGYHAATQLHLVAHAADGLFSGELVNSQTGKIIAAGQAVLFSPNLKYFFASEQPSGMDGEQWVVATIAGRQQWLGRSNVVEHGAIVAELSDVTWSAANELQAKLVCSNEELKKKPASQVVTLKKQGQQWEWLPKVRCSSF